MNKVTAKKITVGVDALAINHDSAGSFVVLLGLMREFINLCEHSFVIYAVSRDIERSLGNLDGRVSYVYAPPWTRNIVLRIVWEQFVLPRLSIKNGCDILYSASGYPELFTSLPVVSHQQNLWSFAEAQRWWSYRTRVKTFLRRITAGVALRTSGANVFISDYLRECANKAFPGTQYKNFTVHDAISRDIETASSSAVIQLNEQFCISVGSIAAHKNYTALLEAFEIAERKCGNLKLLIVGKHNTRYGQKVQGLCRKLNLEQRVVFGGSLAHEEVMELYREALFSINVSLMEGFGLPVLESMASGCSVICSRCTGFPEIGGNAVCYCDPTDIDDIAEKIIKLYSDETLRKHLSIIGLAQAKRFDLRESARTLLRVFENVVDAQPSRSSNYPG